jgi:hypothetical protein
MWFIKINYSQLLFHIWAIWKLYVKGVSKDKWIIHPSLLI